MAEIKKILKNQIYQELKKIFNLKNCYIKVTYENTEDGCDFYITVTIEKMNINVRTVESISNELMCKGGNICRDVVDDVRKSVTKTVNSFIYKEDK